MRAWLGNAGSIILAGLLAVMVWFVAVNETNPLQEGVYPPNGAPIEAINMPTGLELYGGLPDRAQVRLLAPKSFWDDIPSADFRAFVDLKDLEPGIHSVPVEIVCASCDENRARIVSVTPKQVAARLEATSKRDMEVQLNIIGEAALGYALQRPIITPPQVTLRGPRSAIDSIAKVQGAIIVNSARAPIERSVDVFAVDKNGDEVKGIAIEPPQVAVRIPVEQEQGFRDLAVTVVRDVQPSTGYWISNITVDPPTVTVNGPPALIKSLPNSLQTTPLVERDVTQSFQRRMPLVVPDGVTLVGRSDPSVLVKVDVEVERSGRTIEKTPEIRNLAPDLIASVAPQRVQVILSGPIPELRKLDPDRDVNVVVDLAGLGPGVYTITPQVAIAPDGLQKRLVPDRMEVTISAGTPTPRRP